MPDRRDDDRTSRRAPDPPDGDDRDSESESELRPVPKRIGEEPDNLRQRADWFKRRSGNKE